ncbi:hypothetical protein Nepgr_023125 [Nepenthes gracilis]|uniref:Uncharacterized protein n=1 Tax=Nepenthes gracilis TaxID=150966 RepID=A0AAD3XXL8_NEPGR|nr:hypothetical protein Nepgr_023125 [Nepenthes gracilis]
MQPAARNKDHCPLQQPATPQGFRQQKQKQLSHPLPNAIKNLEISRRIGGGTLHPLWHLRSIELNYSPIGAESSVQHARLQAIGLQTQQDRCFPADY